MLKQLLLSGLLAGSAWCQSLQTLNTSPLGAQFVSSGGNLGTYRLEFRVENAQLSHSILSNGGGIGNVNCGIDGSGNISCAQGGDGAPSGNAVRKLTAGQDVRVRFQRDASGLLYTLETWIGGCTNYVRQQVIITNGGALPLISSWHFGGNISLSFSRLYSTLDQAGDCPADAPFPAGDQFDFPFENGSGFTLNDRSGHKYSMTTIGSTHTNSVFYPPLAVITGWSTPRPVFRATQPFSLSGAQSVSFSYPGTGTVSSMQWQQIAPTDITHNSVFSSHTGPLATITSPVAGQYTYQLTVQDSAGNSSTATLVAGVVATDANNIVLLTDPGLAIALGNPLMHGKSPWPWFEKTEAADVDLLAPLMQTPPSETAQTGTCTIPSSLPNQISQGAITEKTYAGVAIVCSGNTPFTSALVGTRVALNWDRDGNGTFKGRFITYVNSVPTPNILVGFQYSIGDPPAALAGGLTWGLLGADYGPYNANDASSFILNFYEAGLAVGREYARTGLTTYQTQFHSFCDNWWTWALDSGFGSAIPRNAGLSMMAACGADPTYTAPTGFWDGIARVTMGIAQQVVYNTATGASDPGYNPVHTAVAGIVDPREESYILRFSALLARLYGAHGGSTAAWCGYVANQVSNVWVATAAIPEGDTSGNTLYWGNNLFYLNISYPGAGHPPIIGPYGTSPWRESGLPNIALIYAYEALSDPNTCNNPTLAAALFNPATGAGIISSAAEFAWDYGRAADGGLFYSVGYESNYGVSAPVTYVWNNVYSVGNISVTSGSATVTGTNTWFNRQFFPGASININSVNYTVANVAGDTSLTLTAPYAGSSGSSITQFGNNCTIAVKIGTTGVTGTNCGFTHMFTGQSWIGIVGIANSTADRYVFGVTSVIDDNHLTLNTAYPGTTTEAGIGTFVYAPPSPTACGPTSKAVYCNPDPFDGRNLSSDIAAGSAWLYKKTGNTTWRTRMEYYENKLFGGPAGGSGSAGIPTGTVVYVRPGKIAVTAGSKTVVGTGTTFTQQFACNGSDQITIADQSTGYTWANYPSGNPTFYTVAVASCTDDTHLILSSNYPGFSSPSISMFYNAADPQWQGADGGVGNLGEILPTCGAANPPPCGIGDFVPKYGKPLGMASGAGNVPIAMADRLGGVSTSTGRVLGVTFNLASIPHAQRVTVSLINPDGTTASNTCFSSPCGIVADSRLTGTLLAIQYKSASGAVLASSSQPAFLQVK